MSENYNSFKKKFKVENLIIGSVGNWVLSLREQQPTVGALILSLGRPCDSLSKISEKEGVDLTYMFRLIEDIYDSTYKPQKINYLGLMMIDEHVHFHVIPRYSEGVVINDNLYRDNFWPGPPLLKELEIKTCDFNVIYEDLNNACKKCLLDIR